MEWSYHNLEDIRDCKKYSNCSNPKDRHKSPDLTPLLKGLVRILEKVFKKGENGKI